MTQKERYKLGGYAIKGTYDVGIDPIYVKPMYDLLKELSSGLRDRFGDNLQSTVIDNLIEKATL